MKTTPKFELKRTLPALSKLYSFAMGMKHMFRSSQRAKAFLGL